MNMRSIRLSIILFSVGSIIGCGSQPGTHVASVKPSPVGGAMVRLPNNAGLVAIKTEADSAARTAKAKAKATKIVAVFFDNDGETPMTPAPTEVSFDLDSLRANIASKTVALEADPAAANRFVSAAGSFPGGLEGKIRVKINGQDLEESFSAR